MMVLWSAVAIVCLFALVIFMMMSDPLPPPPCEHDYEFTGEVGQLGGEEYKRYVCKICNAELWR